MEQTEERRHRRVDLRTIYRRYGGIHNEISMKEAEICMKCPLSDCMYAKNKCPIYRERFIALATKYGMTKPQLDNLLSRLTEAIMIHYVKVDRGDREETPTYSDGLSGKDRKKNPRGRPRKGEELT